MTNAISFDPFTQNFILEDGNGIPFNVSLADLDEWKLFANQECIAMGVQIGACAILLIVLLLLTKPDKRKSAVFILNSLALVIGIIRCVLEGVYWTGPFATTYAYFGDDFSRVPTGDYAQQVTGTVCNVLMQICVEVSLCIQAYVVCVNLRHQYRQLILGMSVLIALAALAVRFALMVENDIYIVQTKQETGLDLLDDAANITTTICICWFCAIFVGKLGVALRERAKLGMQQFGPMQIIFIVGCQTLLIPGTYSERRSSLHELMACSSHLLHYELLRGCISGLFRSYIGGTVPATLIPVGVSFTGWPLSPIETKQLQSSDDWKQRQSLYWTYDQPQSYCCYS